MIWTKEGARYGRTKQIVRDDEATCDVCEQGPRTCLGFDPSEDEYGNIWICEECAHKAFTEGLGNPIKGGAKTRR